MIGARLSRWFQKAITGDTMTTRVARHAREDRTAQRIRLASYNIENLFLRPVVMN